MNIDANPQTYTGDPSIDADGPQVLTGLSGRGAEYVEGDDQRVIIGLFSASRSTSFTATEVRHVAERTIEAALLRPVTGAADTLLHEVGHDIHVALRRTFSPAPPAALGTVALAAVDANKAMFLWTANGAAYLLRPGEPPVHLEGNGLDPDEGTPDLTLVRPDWELQPGDRIIVATRHLTEWFDDATLVEVAGTGLIESAAQTLGAVTDVRSGGAEVAIAVLEIATDDVAAEIDTEGADYADMLEGLAGVLPRPRQRRKPPQLQPLQREDLGFEDTLTPFATGEPVPVERFADHSPRSAEGPVVTEAAPGTGMPAAPIDPTRTALVVGISFAIGVVIGIALFL